MTDAGYLYRTIACSLGLTVVNGLKVMGEETYNIQWVLGQDLTIQSTNEIIFKGGNPGKYIHKIVIGHAERSGLPLVAMIGHHYEDAGFYLFGFDFDRGLVELHQETGLHGSRHR